MAFNVSGLQDYTVQNFDDLISKSLFDAKTMALVMSEGNLKTGIKSSEKIDLMETDAIFQTGGTCDFTASGSTTLTDRQIDVGKIKINENLCPKDLEAKATQKKLQKGSKHEDIPFEKEYTELKAGKIAEQLEKAIWMGDKTSGDVNLNKFDGYVKLIDASGVAIAANVAKYIGGAAITTATGVTESNVRTIVKAVYKALPAALQGKADVRIFCGWDFFQTYLAAFTDSNLFHFAPSGNDLPNGEAIIPGTNYKLTAVHGLDGTDRVFALRMANMYLGTDLEHEEEQFEMWYSKDQNIVKFAVEFKQGVQVALPNEIVHFKLA